MYSNFLITGASGFLGKIIYQKLTSFSKSVTTIGRSPSNSIICDLSKDVPIVEEQNIEIVVHAAGKAHMVPKTKEEIQDFYNVNVNGTKNLLKSLEKNLPHQFVFISTVAVYGVFEGANIDEKYPLNGQTPYAKSKILAEKAVLNFGKRNNVKIVILRLPLITGENPTGNLGDMIKAIIKGYYFRVGKGDAKRSIISSEAVSELILKLKGIEGVYNATDSHYPDIKEIDLHISNVYGKKIKVLPKFIVRLISFIGDVFSFFPLNSVKYSKLTNSLMFSNNRLKNEIDWESKDSLKKLK